MPSVQECRDKLPKNRCNSSWTTAVEKARQQFGRAEKPRTGGNKGADPGQMGRSEKEQASSSRTARDRKQRG